MITVSFLYKGKEADRTFYDVRKAARFVRSLRAKGLVYMGSSCIDYEDAHELARLTYGR